MNQEKAIEQFHYYISLDPESLSNKVQTFLYLRDESKRMTIQNYIEPWLIKLFDSDVFCTYYAKFLDLLNTKDNDSILTRPRNHLICNFIRLSMTVWNVSDKQFSLVVKLSGDICRQLISLLDRDELNIEACHRETNIRLVVRSVVGILHNIVLHCPLERSNLRANQGFRILHNLVNSQPRSPPAIDCVDSTVAVVSNTTMLQIYTAALLVLAIIMSEEENRQLNATDEHIRYLLTALDNALINEKSLFSAEYGYHLHELLGGFTHLVASKANLTLLLNNQFMQRLEQILRLVKQLKFQDTQQQTSSSSTTTVVSHISPNSIDLVANLALICLSSLLVFEPARRLLALGTKFRRLVESFASSPSHCWSRDIQFLVSGIRCCLMEPATASCNSKFESDRSHGDVFLCCSAEPSPLVDHVERELKQHGLKVWSMTQENRGCVSMEQMAQFIVNSSAFVIASSHALKVDPTCHILTLHAYENNIPRFILLTEPDFVPDSWLNIICSLAPKAQLTSRRDSELDSDVFRKGVDRLLNWLFNGHRPAAIQQSPVEPTAPELPMGDNSSPIASTSSDDFPSSPVAINSDLDRLSEWSPRDVHSWLVSHQLDGLFNSVAPRFNGAELICLVRWYANYPDYLMRYLRSRFGIKLNDQLRLFIALSRVKSVLEKKKEMVEADQPKTASPDLVSCESTIADSTPCSDTAIVENVSSIS